MANLKQISITFNTNNDDRDHNTLLHVFIKNRRSTTASSEQNTDYISNLLSYEWYESNYQQNGPSEINPYLGFGQALSLGIGFDDPSSHTFNIPLRTQPIPIDEVILPVVNVHILAQGNDRWMFSYTVSFLFDDGRSFTSTSNQDGVTGVILDQDNRNHSGICTENPYNLQPPPPTYSSNGAVLNQVILQFATNDSSDYDKHGDTTLNVHIVNRLTASTTQDIAVATNLLPGVAFTPKSLHTVVFAAGALSLASNAIRLEDIVLPVVNINIGTSGDRWGFSYRVTYLFSNNQKFTSTTSGIILNGTYHKHSGVYRGDSFPTQTPPTQPALTGPPVDRFTNPKQISLSYFADRLKQFLDNRVTDPIVKLRIHNTGIFGSGAIGILGYTLPESYYDLQSILADPPPPRTVTLPNYDEPVYYESSPSSIGQNYGHLGIGDSYLNDINSSGFITSVNPSSPTPITLQVVFETGGPTEVIITDFPDADFSKFSITLNLTLSYDANDQKIDVMSWIGKSGGDLDKFLNVTLESSGPTGTVHDDIRDNIHKALTSPDPFDGSTTLGKINSFVNSWFLGGVLKSDGYDNGCQLLCAPTPGPVGGCLPINNNVLNLYYKGPQKTFAFPPPPAPWPPANFTPGTLANIDHIVVLTMENRSFDQMLGYLSLPAEKGGLGRTDVDGLKGNESNTYKGVAYPSFPFKPGETVFTPDPLHSYEPVRRAINNGKMDSFVASYAEEHGDAMGPNIMGYHTAVNVPTYDALARDFSIGHRWFASHPGPTFSNRFYELTGRLNLDADGRWEFSNSSPIRPVFTPTIFDHLTENGVSWKYFESGYCALRFFEKYTFDTANIATYSDPVYGFANLVRTGNLPSVTYIDPHFIELPPGGNCDGAPADVRQGQLLVKEVVETLIASPVWEKTLLIVTYDEHGGFYDHVPPPLAPKSPPTPSKPTASAFPPSSSLHGSKAAPSLEETESSSTPVLPSIASRKTALTPWSNPAQTLSGASTSITPQS